MNKKQFFFIAGLPRSGSTLLSNILGQNPEIRAEGNSALPTLMWESQITCDVSALEQVMANRKFPALKNKLLSELPYIYYADAREPIIFDKCRRWCSIENMHMIKQHITENPKVVVLVRPIDEIVKSFIHLHRVNNKPYNPINDLFDRQKNGILIDSIYSVRDAINMGGESFLFVKYSDFVADPKQTLDKIYEFCAIKPFKHVFDNIEDRNLEDDAVYGLVGMHSIRPSIAKSSYDVDLDGYAVNFCNEANELIHKALE